MKTQTETETETEFELKVENDLVAEDDLDDVIEIALRMMQDEEGALTEEEVKEVAAELDIPAEYIERARAQLEKTRLEQKQELERKKKQKLYVGMGAGAVSIVFLLVIGSAYSSVSSLHNAVETQSAQVDNMTTRQKEMDRLMASKPDSVDKTAELVGARNRVRVETKRYNDLVNQYNDSASGPLGSIVTSLTGLPAEMQLKR